MFKAVQGVALTMRRAASTYSPLTISFKGKRAVVTGASGGIGRTCAITLAESGAEVVAVARSAEKLKEMTKLHPNITPLALDLSKIDTAREELKKIGDIDLLVNNAGIANLTDFLHVSSKDFHDVMTLNVQAALVASQVAAQSMINRKVPGAIVNVSSQASEVGLANHTVYCASKGALDNLTRVMAVELGPHKIRVNAVNPTVVMTDMGRLAWSDPAKAGPMLSRIPLGRFAEEKEVVSVIAFLLSDHAAMVHGAMVPVDGGFWAA